MGTVAVVTTGGTIASVRDADGTSAPALAAAELLAGVAVPAGTEVRVVDLLAADSSVLTLADMQAVSDAVGAELARPDTVGVVVVHGTDAMEETALLLDLQHRDPRPVVVTGAQRTADDPDADGPANLRTALALAAGTHGRPDAPGVLVTMGGRVLPAAGTTKRSTVAVDGFAHEPGGAPLPHLTAPVSGVRVDLVAVHPGGDATHLDASLAAGAHGVVLAGLGSGNATPAIVAGVARCTARGVPVAVSTRVPTGPLSPGYGGGGGGHDLVAAGAVHAHVLRPGQARVLLAALIAAGAPDAQVRAAFGPPGS
ncbi:asparaginase [Nocardioides sp. ChNu-153]|uniref:asparaginase domain-containing protein n=1 Tax=unclassified Nocardioides TaxID=2615069 RepID=UPI002405658F|nr:MULTISPECIES: asparaginase domain-containing protein [unclassified Nocardioides]MDF9716642.1 asparaginase [Nocardioides sp. ChNu-99]MDN7123069.1 asparaginase [Nocardioides sp. ChNu-153]